MTDKQDQANSNEEETTGKRLTPKQIAEEIESAEKWQKTGQYKLEGSRWGQWEKNKKYLMCVWPDSGENDVNVNTVWSNYHTEKPTLYFQNPKITGTPTKPKFTRDLGGNVVRNEQGRPQLIDNYMAARIASMKINYELREIKFKKLMRKVTGDCLCPYGIGWAKIGYSKISVSGHSNERDTDYTYWIKRVDPRNIVYSWRATDIDDCFLIAERLILTFDEAEEYGFDIPEGYVAKLPDFLKNRSKDSKSEKAGEKLFICWEVYDLKNDVLYWVLSNEKETAAAKFVKEPVDEPYPFDGSCYVPLVLNEDNDDIIGLSEVEPIEDQALAINKIRTKQTKHMQWFGTRVTYVDGALSPTSIDQTKNTDHGVYTKIEVGHTPAEVRVDSPPSIGQDAYAMTNEHKEDIRITLGLTEFQQGSVGAASIKATIGNIVQNSANNRIEEKRDIIHDFVIDCVRKLFACIQTFSSDEEYLNIKDEVMDDDFVNVLKEKYGYDPKIPFLKMSREDIQGEYNFEFNVEDMIVVPKEIRAQQFTNFLSAVFSNQLLAQRFVEEFDIGKTLKKGAELFGIDLGELKKGGPAQIDEEVENQMFKDGMEVPEPHEKDKDDKHIVSHMRLVNELETQLSQGTSGMSQLQQRIQSTSTNIDPTNPQNIEMAQKMVENGKAQLQQIVLQLQPLQDIIRKAKIHIQWHDLNRKRKETSGMSLGSGGFQQSTQPQPSASQQTGLQSQAQQVQ